MRPISFLAGMGAAWAIDHWPLPRLFVLVCGMVLLAALWARRALLAAAERDPGDDGLSPAIGPRGVALRPSDHVAQRGENMDTLA